MPSSSRYGLPILMMLSIIGIALLETATAGPKSQTPGPQVFGPQSPRSVQHSEKDHCTASSGTFQILSATCSLDHWNTQLSISSNACVACNGGVYNVQYQENPSAVPRCRVESSENHEPELLSKALGINNQLNAINTRSPAPRPSVAELPMEFTSARPIIPPMKRLTIAISL